VGASVSRGKHLDTVPNAVGSPIPRAERTGKAKSLLERQLLVIQEMIADMDAQTGAGQRHTMDKIVAFLRSHVDGRTVARRNGRELLQMVGQLEQEARRPAPDVCLFAKRADALVTLLSAMT
jgi:hypothetical protein